MNTLERYTNLEPLSADESGERFRAHNPETDREIELWVLTPELSSDEGVKEYLSLLPKKTGSHLTLFDRRFEHDSRTVLVSEIVTGEPVAQYITRHLPDPERAFTITRDLARGLKVLHNAGLVHGHVDLQSTIVVSEGRGMLVGMTLPPAADVESARDTDLLAMGQVFSALMTGKSTMDAADISGLSTVARLVVRRMTDPDPHERFENVDALLVTLEEALLRGVGEEPDIHRKKGFTPRQYLSLAVLMLLLIILWFVLSFTWPHEQW